MTSNCNDFSAPAINSEIVIASMIRNIFRAQSQRLRVVLDMDECLVHSQIWTGKFSDVESNPLLESFVTEFEYGGETHTVHTNKRPYLTQFLEQYSERFDFDIFTAAMPHYADPVLDALDPEEKFFSKRYYRESCPAETYYAKDLEVCLAGSDHYQSISRIVLVDNSTRSFVQPSNCILVPSWYDDPNDDLLKKTLPALLEELDAAGDVRDGVNKWMECHYPDELARVRDRRPRMRASRGQLRSEEEYQHLEEAWDILREHRDDRNTASDKLSTKNLTALMRWAAPMSSVDARWCTSKQDMLRQYWEMHDIAMMEDEVSAEDKGDTPDQFADDAESTKGGEYSMNPEDDQMSMSKSGEYSMNPEDDQMNKSRIKDDSLSND